MFNLNEALLSVLKNVGRFSVTIDKYYVTLQRETPFNREWKISLAHNNSDSGFVSTFEEYTDYFSPQEEFDAFNLFSKEKLSEVELSLVKEDMFWRGRQLHDLSGLLDMELSQIYAIENNKKMNSPLPKEIIQILNDSGIRVVNLFQNTEYNGEKGIFTSAILRCFAYQENNYLVNVTFDDRSLSLNHVYRNYSFNCRFRKEVLDKTAKYTRGDLIQAYRENPQEALKMLSVLESQNAALQIVADKIDAVYNKQ